MRTTATKRWTRKPATRFIFQNPARHLKTSHQFHQAVNTRNGMVRRGLKDEAAETAARLREVEGTKSRLLQMVSEKIAPLQDAVDLGIATDDEKARLDEWEKYRVLVNRMDTSAPDWPEVPISH